MSTAPQAPTGFLGVVNNLASAAGKVAETVSDVRSSRGETQVVAVPVGATPPSTTPGIVPGDVARANAQGSGPMPKDMRLVYAGAALLAVLAVVMLVRKR